MGKERVFNLIKRLNKLFDGGQKNHLEKKKNKLSLSELRKDNM